MLVLQLQQELQLLLIIFFLGTMLVEEYAVDVIILYLEIMLLNTFIGEDVILQ